MRRNTKRKRNGGSAEAMPRLLVDATSLTALPTEPVRTRREEQLSRQLRQLEQRRNELLNEFAGTSLEFHDCSGTVTEGDQAEYRTSHASRLRELTHLAEAVRSVESAIAQAARGSYGLCTDCARRIPKARLLVNPVATRCIRCQERFEMGR